MPVIVNLATSHSFKALVLTEKTLKTVNCFKHSKSLSEKIQTLRQERADRIRIKEQIRAMRKMRLVKKLEPPVMVEKLRDYDRMKALVYIGDMQFNLAEAYKARSKPRNAIGILLERHIQNNFLARAAKNIMEASQEADREVDGLKNLTVEISYKRDLVRMLKSRDVLTAELYHLRSELEKELPKLENKLQQDLADLAIQPRHGN
ncbi:MAG: hypothetical protein NTX79_06200 [Candidatus Micrarchaeota archaeon]|nr:hypothetical protein [Candidatus Micrarchaeota archaeon]